MRWNIKKNPSIHKISKDFLKKTFMKSQIRQKKNTWNEQVKVWRWQVCSTHGMWKNFSSHYHDCLWCCIYNRNINITMQKFTRKKKIFYLPMCDSNQLFITAFHTKFLLRFQQFIIKRLLWIPINAEKIFSSNELCSGCDVEVCPWSSYEFYHVQFS